MFPRFADLGGRKEIAENQSRVNHCHRPEQREGSGGEGREKYCETKARRGGRRKRAKRGQKGRKALFPPSVRPFSLARPKFLVKVDPTGLRRESQCGASFLPASALPARRPRAIRGRTLWGVIVRDRAFLFLSSKDRTQRPPPPAFEGGARGGWCGGREGGREGGRPPLWTFLLLPPSLSFSPLRNSGGDLSKAVDIFSAH